MKYTITNIGVVDASKELHRKFAIKALEHQLHTECVLNYELHSDGQLTLSDTIHKKS